MINKNNRRLVLVCLLCACSPNVLADQSREQLEMQQMMEMMKSQGMDPQQMQQFEGFMQNMMQMETQKKDAEVAKKQQAFEQQTTGHGTATVVVEGRQYDLKITECEVRNSQQSVFTIRARQAPGLDDAELSIYSDGVGRPQSVHFSTRTRPPTNYQTNDPQLQLAERSLTWQGQVDSDQRALPMTLNLSCGKEAVFYDTASRERPDTDDNVVTLYLGPETYTFEAGRCSSDTYRNGNWEVFFEVTATGSFRGRPAIVLLESGRGIAGTESAGAGESHGMDLLLGEITAEQRQLSPHALTRQLREKVDAYRNQQMAAYQKKYDKDYWNSLSPSEMGAAMNASNAEMSAMTARADAMQFPAASSHEGVTTFSEEGIVFRGPAMRTSDAERAPELQNLTAMPELFVTCRN